MVLDGEGVCVLPCIYVRMAGSRYYILVSNACVIFYDVIIADNVININIPVGHFVNIPFINFQYTFLPP